MQVCLGSRLLASTPIPDERLSFAFFCPGCGEVWGRVVRGKGWYSVLRPCVKHPSPSKVGGSFFQEFDWHAPRTYEAFLTKFPSLAEWEFEVHLRWATLFGESL